MITAPVDAGRVRALVRVVVKGKDGEIHGKLNYAYFCRISQKVRVGSGSGVTVKKDL